MRQEPGLPIFLPEIIEKRTSQIWTIETFENIICYMLEQNRAGQQWKVPSFSGIPLDSGAACLSSPAFLRRTVAHKPFKIDQQWLSSIIALYQL